VRTVPLCRTTTAAHPLPHPGCSFPLLTVHLIPHSSPPWRRHPNFSEMAPPPPPAARAARSSTKRALSPAADDVIDVDEPVPLPVLSSSKGKGKATVSRSTDQPIDVDDPASWVDPPSGVGGSSSSVPLGPRPPPYKFSGAVGMALYEQKMEVLTEQGRMPADGGEPATSASAVPGSSGPAGSAWSTAVVPTPSRQRRRASASAPPYHAPVVSPVLNSLLDLERGSRVEQEVLHATPATMSMPPPPTMPSKSRRRGSRNVRTSLPRKPHKFVSRAPRMTAPSTPYVVAFEDPPTPPESQSSRSTQSHDGYGSDADDAAGDELADDDIHPRAVGRKTAGEASTCEKTVVESKGGPAHGSGAAHSASLAAAPKSAAQAGQAAAAAAAIDVQALADRTRNPRMFPAAFWMPGAQAVFAGYSGHAVPPALPPVVCHTSPATARVQGTPIGALATGPPLPPLPLPPPPAPLAAFLPVGPTTQPPCLTPPVHGDAADVEDLVTPGASPASTPAWSPAGSPQSPSQPSLGKRRRASTTRAPRAAAGSASGAAVGDREADQAGTRAQDVLLDAMRNGFSSVRRELTRLRSEVVVVKSQAASALRRMDGLAATADDRQSHHGTVIERLSRLDASIRGLGERLPKPDDDEGPPGQSSLTLVNEIKVRNL